MVNGKDYILRFLAFLAYIIAFYFSWISIDFRDASPEMTALIWGLASLIYWFLAYTFEERDRRWQKENVE